MRTREEVKYAFTPVGKLGLVEQTALLKTEQAFRECADEVMLLVPECADRTAALRKLLESKMTCIQAITHCKPLPAQASQPAQASAQKELASSSQGNAADNKDNQNGKNQIKKG